MIEVSASYGFGSDNRQSDNGPIPQNIQLALYKYELFQQQKKEIFKAISRSHTHVKVAHMPLDFLRHDQQLMIEMIKELRDELGVFKFIVHPNKGIKEFIVFCNTDPTIWDVQLCIENLTWRKKKELRNPLKIIEYIAFMRQATLFRGDPPIENFRFCLDTSHTEDIWFEYQMMYYLLPYTSVIHLSNREGRKQHLPFNTSKGDLNLVGFVKDLKKRYNWSGDIVLEYMPEYRHKLIPNADYIKRLLYGRNS